MVYIGSSLLDIFSKKNYHCLSCFSCYSSLHCFFWCINVILSLSLQMVSAKSKRGLIKALYNATRESKGNRCLNLTSQFFDLLSQSVIRYAHSKSDSYEWQHLDTWLNLRSQGFHDQWQAWYLGTFATSYHHQTIRTSNSRWSPYHITKSVEKWPVKKWIRLGKWIRPRRGWTSLPRYGKNLNKYFVVPLKRRAVALSLGCNISSTASKIIGLGLRPLEVRTWPMKGALWGLTLILFGLSFGLCAALELYCHYQGLPVQGNLHGQ